MTINNKIKLLNNKCVNWWVPPQLDRPSVCVFYIMKKLTRQQKEIINKAFDGIFDTVAETAEIEVEEFGSALTGFSVEGGNDFLKIIGDMFSIDFSDREVLWTLEEIKSLDSQYDLHSIEDLKEVDSNLVDRGFDKYQHREVVFLHKPSGKHLMFTEQRCSRSGEFLSWEFNGEVSKKEVVVTSWA